MLKNKINPNLVIISVLIIAIFSFSVISMNSQNTVQTSTEINESTKIEWGIKRNDNHEQPDVGADRKKILEENNGICLGNKDKKCIYLTFDQGYEAGYTASILDTLKENEVHATFFITGHYLNTQSNLVKRMLEEGHLVRKSISAYVDGTIKKTVK